MEENQIKLTSLCSNTTRTKSLTALVPENFYFVNNHFYRWQFFVFSVNLLSFFRATFSRSKYTNNVYDRKNPLKSF